MGLHAHWSDRGNLVRSIVILRGSRTRPSGSPSRSCRQQTSRTTCWSNLDAFTICRSRCNWNNPCGVSFLFLSFTLEYRFRVRREEITKLTAIFCATDINRLDTSFRYCSAFTSSQSFLSSISSLSDSSDSLPRGSTSTTPSSLSVSGGTQSLNSSISPRSLRLLNKHPQSSELSSYKNGKS